jgi:hypothetical protein
VALLIFIIFIGKLCLHHCIRRTIECIESYTNYTTIYGIFDGKIIVIIEFDYRIGSNIIFKAQIEIYVIEAQVLLTE